MLFVARTSTLLMKEEKENKDNQTEEEQEHDENQPLQEEDGNDQNNLLPEGVLNVVSRGAVGAAVGVAVVGGAFFMIGLGPLGPVAGGWFAANMGAGLTAGSVMSLAQSAAMTGAGYVYGATAGGVVGAATGAFVREKKQ
eukprot:scaffold1709_cov158-Ochromonas_danica.AAC.20